MSHSTRQLLFDTARRLAAMQYPSDGHDWYRGEFPMRIQGTVDRLDHNFLSGYALRHVALASQRPGVPENARSILQGILATAALVPGQYQSTLGTGNWYHGKASRCRSPVDYPWPGGVVVALCDDYDDTAIAAQLAQLGPFKPRIPHSIELFLEAAHTPGVHLLVPKSVRRMELAGVTAGVYQSWVLPGPDPEITRRAAGIEAPVVIMPQANSVELTTVANIAAVVHLLGGDPELPTQRASVHFVNALARCAIKRLLEGDASWLDFASSYYPRFPFAPLCFLVQDHALMGGELLTPETQALLRRAVLEVSEDAYSRMSGFGTRAYWLSCAAWCAVTGLIERRSIIARLRSVWERVRAERSQDGLWPFIVFFHSAHVGDYGGLAYVQALVLELLALLLELEVD